VNVRLFCNTAYSPRCSSYANVMSVIAIQHGIWKSGHANLHRYWASETLHAILNKFITWNPEAWSSVTLATMWQTCYIRIKFPKQLVSRHLRDFLRKETVQYPVRTVHQAPCRQFFKYLLVLKHSLVDSEEIVCKLFCCLSLQTFSCNWTIALC